MYELLSMYTCIYTYECVNIIIICSSHADTVKDDKKKRIYINTFQQSRFCLVYCNKMLLIIMIIHYTV